MHKTVKIVNGYEIKRMVGTHGCYHILLKDTGKSQMYAYFRTIKAAAEYAAHL